ncbi:2-hydroxyacid dehydrogenase [Clostridium septicum]|uniref:2-hydroxyacid dehydrogenase n=1 Tax=Clostridium septicum TaxID=1504 RepID=A0A9N7PKL1_CLOSE|nr:2-hydroxyacid dehydrogenase [Clostridium septicum]AYE34137.1 lactate dehydrogenase [Clostridium septicum]MDU1313064.1 2-hydroxyacid dehydrogenase [Clostridium septicum]QAS59505.1 lactate dehydrogenase [Clostridium septicum]UEC21234.1 2-hydroxyacid dehydrogenase [Clostridium septicum]USS00720.1 2-hydroxyacid dehydrogenase [Clostridium septicum]
MSIKLVCYGVRDTEVPFFHKLNKYGYQLVLVNKNLDHENVKEALGAEAIMVRGNCKADRQNLELLKLHGLKTVLTRTVGFDHVDLEATKDLDLKVARVPGYSPNAISELAVTLAMMLVRNTAYTTNRTKDKNFVVDSQMFSKEIRNCTVGVLALGRIGLTTAKLFKGLGANVIGYDVFQSDVAKEVVEFKSLDEVLAESDVIAVHTPYIKGQNYHMIDDEFIAKMKDGAILINTARGEVQDLDAITRALESGKLGGFGTDVIEGESGIFFNNLTGQTINNASVEKLIGMYPKALVTPHMGSYTDEALRNMISISYDNLNDIIETGNSKNEIA